MYDDTIETIQLSETTRACLVYDFSLECPFEWGSIGSAHTLNVSPRLMSMAKIGAVDPEGDDIDSLLSNMDYYTDMSEDERNEAVLKHLKRKGYTAIIAEVGGREGLHIAVFYDKGDGVSEATIKASISTYRAWAKGEVYGVIVERQKVWHSGTDTMTTWEPVGSLWGIYSPTEAYIREIADDILAESAAA
jgi:hypothetical protein